MRKEIRIAIYLRLSRQEEEEGIKRDESGSISTQRKLLRSYVEEHFQDYELEEFLDDGYSGTNFERPGVKALLKAAGELAVNCIVVKDFSRFSRDYIELGTYIDQIFPFMGIRFISVNDHYDSGTDSAGTGQIEIPFQNLLYDLYSKDLSLKVKAALDAKKKMGQFVSANVPFGYEKDPEDRHRLIVKEGEAGVVRRIFELTQNGMTSVQIARRFNQEGIGTPAALRAGNTERERRPKGGRYLWSSSQICHILENPVYAGDMVYGKYYRRETGGKSHLRPKEEWKICHNHHEPLVSGEVFEEVQRSRGRKRTQKGGARHPLTGKLVCAGCGRNLRIRRGKSFYFSCEGRYVSGEEKCVRKLDGTAAEKRVLLEMQKKAAEAFDVERIWEQRREMISERLRSLKRKREKAERELRRLGRERLERYERFVTGEETADGFWTQGSVRKEREEGLRLQLEEIKEELDAAVRERGAGREMSVLMDFLGLSKLTREQVDRWIDRIIVRREELEIHWKEKEF